MEAHNPAGHAVAVALGCCIQVFDCRSQHSSEAPMEHAAAVRDLTFDPAGRMLLSGGDDKCARAWDAATGSLLHTWEAPKKISAVAFSGDSRVALFADNTITALVVAPGGRRLASADRDGKVRVSVLPRTPLLGVPEIQSFCLGHTAFASCVAFADCPAGLRMLSGSGDGTVRLWDPESGSLLATLAASALPAVPAADGAGAAAADQAAEDAAVDEELLEKAAVAAPSGHLWLYPREELPPAVLCIAVAPDGRTAAIAVEGQPELLVLDVDGAAGTLTLTQELELPGLTRPTAAAFDRDGRLWVVGGVAAEGARAGVLQLRVAVRGSHGGFFAEGAGGLAAAAQAAVEAAYTGGSEEGAVAHTGAAPLQLNSQLKKRVFSEELTAVRKRTRAEQ
ncbi:hypothetical protein WJX81_008598 [Elliptochloris bilobata]|uniref:tRNA (guanine-N(7)-)-methyltransferase non-catalytic subunit n=1 Tax=Elliptochloris bilobata TaxID=381761 RepID=A0AAW1QLW6_9CHLO